MIDPDLTHYGVFLQEIHSIRDTPDELSATTTITIKSTATATNVNAEQLIRDLALMSAVRGTADPAVKDAFEKLLTIMALTQSTSTRPQF